MSRTATAPFDRLRIFLITRPPDLGGALVAPKPGIGGIKAIASAVVRIYSEGGVLAFWTGNGLSVAKIFPESAIKFFAYESSVRWILFVVCKHCCLIVFCTRNVPLPSIGIRLTIPRTLVGSVGSFLGESEESPVSSVSVADILSTSATLIEDLQAYIQSKH